MGTSRIHLGLKLILYNRKYKVSQLIDKNTFMIKDEILESNTKVLSTLDFMSLASRGDLKIIKELNEGLEIPFFDITMLDRKEQLEIMRKWLYGKNADEDTKFKSTNKLFDISRQRTQKEIENKARQEISIGNKEYEDNLLAPMPTIKTVRKYRDIFRKTGGSVRAFRTNNQSKGNRNPKSDPLVSDLIKEAFDEHFKPGARKRIKDIKIEIDYLRGIRNEERNKKGQDLIPEIPESTVYYFSQQYTKEEKISVQYSVGAAHHLYHDQGENYEPKRPLEICESDHSSLNLYVIDMDNELILGVPTLTAIKDKTSRCVHGMHVGFAKSGFWTISEALRHAILPKTYLKEQYPDCENNWDSYGVPENLVMDNGSDFTSEDLKLSCEDLGMNVEYNPPRHPWFKGSIERFFRSMYTDMIESLPGALVKFLKKYDPLYKPEETACIPYDLFLELLHLWVVDIYHHKKHRGLFKRTPAMVWKKAYDEHGIITIDSDDDLKIILGGSGSGQLHEWGIRRRHLIYDDSRNPEFTKLKIRLGRKGYQVRYKFDLNDISALQIWDELNQNFIFVPAIRQGYTKGLSDYQHERHINMALKDSKKVNDFTLAKSYKKMQHKIQMLNPILNKNKKMTQREAQYKHSGKNNVQYTVTANISKDSEDEKVVIKEEITQPQLHTLDMVAESATIKKDEINPDKLVSNYSILTSKNREVKNDKNTKNDTRKESKDTKLKKFSFKKNGVINLDGWSSNYGKHSKKELA